MNSSDDKALPAQLRWRKLCVCVVALSVGVPGHTAPQKPFWRAKTQADDFARPNSPHPPHDLLLKEEDARKADALAAFSQGVLAEEDADSDKALESYRKVLNLDPGFSDLASKVALELVRRKNFDQAISVLKDVIKVSPSNPEIPLYVAQIYARHLKKFEQAIRYADQTLELDPKNQAAFLTLFEAHLSDRQPKKAEQVLERVSKIDNLDSAFWLQLGEIYSRAILKENADPKQEDLQKVNAVYQKALGFEPRKSEVLLRVADYYTSSHQFKEAIPFYEEIIKQLQADPDAMLPSVQDKLAVCYRLAGRPKEAIASLKQLITQNPLRYESYELLAGVYEEQGDLENALANYQQILLMNPALPVNYLRVADLFLKTKNCPKAVEVLKEARAKFPEIPQITYSLAIALAQGKQNQEALTAFSECFHDAKASEPDMLNAAFYFAYGVAAEQAGSIEQAEVMLKKSIEVDPDNSAQACNYLGYMWTDRGLRLEEAGKLIERALELNPDNAAFLDSLGWFHFKKGDYPKALEELKKAASLITPEDAVVFEHLGDTLFNLGNGAEALANWRKALALDKENKGLQEKIDGAAKPASPNPVPANK